MDRYLALCPGDPVTLDNYLALSPSPLSFKPDGKCTSAALNDT